MFYFKFYYCLRYLFKMRIYLAQKYYKILKSYGYNRNLQLFYRKFMKFNNFHYLITVLFDYNESKLIFKIVRYDFLLCKLLNKIIKAR